MHYAGTHYQAGSRCSRGRPHDHSTTAWLWVLRRRASACAVAVAPSPRLIRYRAGRGRGAPIRSVTIGKRGSPWTAESARAEDKRILAAVATGGDPAGQRAAERTAPTVADLAARFLEEHAIAKRKQCAAEECRHLINLFVLPALGKRKVSAVTRADIAKLHHDMRLTSYGPAASRPKPRAPRPRYRRRAKSNEARH